MIIVTINETNKNRLDKIYSKIFSFLPHYWFSDLEEVTEKGYNVHFKMLTNEQIKNISSLKDVSVICE